MQSDDVLDAALARCDMGGRLEDDIVGKVLVDSLSVLVSASQSSYGQVELGMVRLFERLEA